MSQESCLVIIGEVLAKTEVCQDLSQLPQVWDPLLILIQCTKIMIQRYMIQKAALQAKVQGGYVLEHFLQWTKDDFTRFENKSVPSLLAGEFLRYHRSIFSQCRYVDTGCKNKPDVPYLVYLSTSLYRGNSGVEKAKVILLIDSLGHSLDLPWITSK